ncbi:hypothetical protein GCM10018781_10340 [Kitasatospora indigofera]|uniref:Uncharacterized protein n=1 Tax=Kitasatospora indigofera TaxID=67307 RepID=A0A919FDJ5_9ACTN|nr:hypothetical protein [Kitasatospora indigofera]GHH62323.1 hypothetical protein GCM10018781_10340 [Kitasatospora indigofera]
MIEVLIANQLSRQVTGDSIRVNGSLGVLAKSACHVIAYSEGEQAKDFLREFFTVSWTEEDRKLAKHVKKLRNNNDAAILKERTS